MSLERLQYLLESCAWKSKIVRVSFSLLLVFQVDATAASLYSLLPTLLTVRAMALVRVTGFRSLKFFRCNSFTHLWSFKLWDFANLCGWVKPPSPTAVVG